MTKSLNRKTKPSTRKRASIDLARRWAWETIKAHSFGDLNIRPKRVS